MHPKLKTVLIIALPAVIVFACNSDNDDSKGESSSAANAVAAVRMNEKEDLIKRGNYIVTTASCNDCHSPKTFTSQGLMADSTKLLSGHPATSKLPPVNPDALKPGQWGQIAPDVTAFVGPWGISYAANLTPDSATGIGMWTEEVFIKTLRTGKHLGQENGRQILPPMPWNYVGQMTDDDLRAVYTYLKSLPPINNRVPAPTPPNEVKTTK